MIKKKTKLPLDVLLNHLKKYKDAVVILGPDIANKNVCVTEESKDSFNRKTMVRNPQKFWSYYTENLMQLYSYQDITTETVEALLDLKLHSTVIDTNIIDILTHTHAIAPAGKNKILNQPEFNNVDKIKKIFSKLFTKSGKRLYFLFF